MLLITKPQKEYELLDSGEGMKLERFGNVLMSRPDPQALWPKKLPDSEWQKAVAVFSKTDGEKNGWKIKSGTPKKWQIDFAGLKFWIKPTPFKHVGLFPEQSENWKWVREAIEANKGPVPAAEARPVREISVLNLFGYTGGATLAAAKAGAKVCYVDGSKSAITWAKENAEISGLSGKPVRWILDDALAFVKREMNRGNFYDGIIMDPPAFGRGPKGELWKIEENFLELLEKCKQILSQKPLFLLINGYSAGYSAIAYENNLIDLAAKYGLNHSTQSGMIGRTDLSDKSVLGGKVESGELAIEESKSGRLLPCGIFGRWSR